MRNGGSEVAPCQQPVGGRGREPSPALLCSRQGQEGGDLDEAASQRLDAGGA